jgi:homoserine O-acetyltransferase
MNKHLFTTTTPFQLENGTILPELELAYYTWGQLNEDKSNVVWVCHALTANADAADWWAGLVGENDLFNPNDHFIICVNMLGSCYGSTSPVSLNPETHQPYHTNFPLITIRDIVNSLEVLRKHLEINSIHTCIGGSMGGMQAMEWAIAQPDVIKNLVLLATNAKHSAWGIAFNESQRMAIKADATWNTQNYYAGQAGLKAARAMAMLSYRNYEMYYQSQEDADNEKVTDFKSSSYQQYQGKKLVDRFNVLSYLSLINSMDTHNVGRGRGGVALALQQITAKTLVIGISSDLLFPPHEQQLLAQYIPQATYAEIDSYYGHDGFLTETKRITTLVKDFLYGAGQRSTVTPIEIIKKKSTLQLKVS